MQHQSSSESSCFSSSSCSCSCLFVLCSPRSSPMADSNESMACDITQVEGASNREREAQSALQINEENIKKEPTSKAVFPPKGKGKATKRKGKEVVAAVNGKKRTSPVWNDFCLPVWDEESGKHSTSCFHCDRTYFVDIANHGTSTLLTHIRKCPKHPNTLEAKSQSKLVFKTIAKGLESETQLSSWSFDQASARKALVKMLVLNELPFRFVESNGFRLFLECICPMFVVPSRTTVNRDVTSMFLFEKNKLKEYFKLHKPRVCLTTDTWTSVQQINYMCITLHFIDQDWTLHKKIINFCPILSHTGEDIGKSIEKCLIEWGITSVLTITVDNASSNQTALDFLKKKLCSGNSGSLDGRYMHMRCIAHIINLIVKEGIKLVGKAVEKIRACVRFIRQSPQRIAKFKKCAAMCNIDSKSFLCLDVATRWNSTFFMLQSACVYEHAFELYADEDCAIKIELATKKMSDSNEVLGMITDEDWVDVKKVMNFLSHFYELTVRVSGSSYITANSILDEISDTFSILKANIASDNELSAMCMKMREKFDKYWGDIDNINLLIFIARIFDPRGKLLFVKYVINVMYPLKSDKLFELVRGGLYELFDDYAKMYSNSVTKLSGDDLSRQPTSLVDDKSAPQRGVLAAQFLQVQCSSQCPKTELDKYLKEELEDSSNSSFSILQWWKSNSQRFPIMSRMARDILAIPISTVSSESAFSTGGRVLNDYRASLIPTTVECLICVQDWIRSSPKEIELEETLYEVEATDEDFKAFLESVKH